MIDQVSSSFCLTATAANDHPNFISSSPAMTFAKYLGMSDR